jgi:hypothetical protein
MGYESDLKTDELTRERRQEAVSEPTEENKQPTGSHKRVDEDWKRQVEREKQREAAKETQQRPTAAGPPPPEATSFTAFITGLAMQAMMALGEMADPKTGLQRENLGEARYLIDMLTMLQEKTRGNLTEQEAAAIEEAVYSLRMTYVRKVSGQPKGADTGRSKGT